MTGIARIDRQVGVRAGFKVGLAVVAPGDVARDRVGICGRIAGGLNVGKSCNRCRLFERLVVANRIIRIARMLRVCDQSFLIQSILGDKSLFGAFRSICSIQIANFLDCFLPKILLIKPS